MEPALLLVTDVERVRGALTNPGEFAWQLILQPLEAVTDAVKAAWNDAKDVVVDAVQRLEESITNLFAGIHRPATDNDEVNLATASSTTISYVSRLVENVRVVVRRLNQIASNVESTFEELDLKVKCILRESPLSMFPEVQTTISGSVGSSIQSQRQIIARIVGDTTSTLMVVDTALDRVKPIFTCVETAFQRLEPVLRSPDLDKFTELIKTIVHELTRKLPQALALPPALAEAFRCASNMQTFELSEHGLGDCKELCEAPFGNHVVHDDHGIVFQLKDDDSRGSRFPLETLAMDEPKLWMQHHAEQQVQRGCDQAGAGARQQEVDWQGGLCQSGKSQHRLHIHCMLLPSSIYLQNLP